MALMHPRARGTAGYGVGLCCVSATYLVVSWGSFSDCPPFSPLSEICYEQVIYIRRVEVSI
jgi:hypothetical protein